MGTISKRFATIPCELVDVVERELETLALQFDGAGFFLGHEDAIGSLEIVIA